MIKKTSDKVPNLTAILVKDRESQGFTSFFAQFPNIIAEGDNEKDALKNLFVLASDVFKHQEKEEIEAVQEYDGDTIITHSFPLSAVAV